MGFVWVEKATPKRKIRRAKVTKTYAKLSKLTGRASAMVTFDLTTGIQAFKRRVSKEDLAKAFETGDFLATMRMVPWEKLPEDLGEVFDRISATTGQAARIQLEKLPPNVNERLRFDATNPRIKAYLDRKAAALVTQIEDDARANIRDVIRSSFTKAQTPRQLAERIKGSIGLLPAHERALANYRAGLEADGRSAKDVERLGDKYEAKLLDYRARSIARTETRAAVNHGQLAIWREGARQGLIDRATAEKEIVVDGNPCDVCEPLDGTRVGLDDIFDVDGEAFDGPPFHTHCMCGLELHFGEGEQAAEDED